MDGQEGRRKPGPGRAARRRRNCPTRARPRSGPARSPRRLTSSTSAGERLSALQEALYAEGVGGGQPAGAARAAGHGHLRQGRHGVARARPGEPDGRPRTPAFKTPTPAELRAPLPLADPQAAARARPDRRLRPLALRGHPGPAGVRPAHRGRTAAPLRRDQRVRGRNWPRRAPPWSRCSCTSRRRSSSSG